MFAKYIHGRVQTLKGLPVYWPPFRIVQRTRIMPRKLIRRYLPDPEAMRQQWFLRPFEALLHDPALLFPNRRSASMALAIGLFWACVPIPLQMVPSGLMAIWLRVNLPIALASVWATNPVTMGPLLYAEYRLGAWLLGRKGGEFQFELSLEWLAEGFLTIWQPMLLGTLIFAITFSVLGYLLLNVAWKISVMRRYRARPHFRLFPFRRRGN